MVPEEPVARDRLSDGTAAEAAVAGRTMRPVPYSMCGRDGANM